MSKQPPARTTQIEKVTVETPDIAGDRLAVLRDLFPEAFTEGRVDFEKLQEALGEFTTDRPERYSFNWAGKRDAIQLLQTPSRATLVPDRQESVNFEGTENVFIEGDNLEVLKLLYKSYFGRVKMIYIDPPYNTGNDFIYPDNYADPLSTYLQITGQKDSQGNLLTSNPETGGRYHSAWLSMMYPRLFLARQLLRDDGVIFVSIDDHEVHNLRMLMNEVFGEENFVASVCWQTRYSPSNDTVDFSASHDYLIVYGRQREFNQGGTALPLLNRLERTEQQNRVYKNPDDDPRGPWRPDNYLCNKTAEQRPNLYYAITHPVTGEEIWPNRAAVWRYSRERHRQNEAENRVWWGLNGANKIPAYKRFLSAVGGVVADTWWSFKLAGHSDEAKKEVAALFAGATRFFDTPKPVRLLKRVVSLATVGVGEERDDQELILDFFAGSGTTAQAVLELNREDGGNRRFIMVQLPEPTDNPDFPTIADIGKERIRRVIKKMKTEGAQGKLDISERGTPEDLGFKVFKLSESNFKPWDRHVEPVETHPETLRRAQGDGKPQPEPVDAQGSYAHQLDMFSDPLVDGWTPDNLIYEVAVKEGYGLNCRIEAVTSGPPETWRVTDPDKEQSFLICLADKLSLECAASLNLTPDDLFIARDRALDDETAANLALQCRLKTL